MKYYHDTTTMNYNDNERTMNIMNTQWNTIIVIVVYCHCSLSWYRPNIQLYQYNEILRQYNDNEILWQWTYNKLTMNIQWNLIMNVPYHVSWQWTSAGIRHGGGLAHTAGWWGLCTAAAEKPSQLFHLKLGSWRAGPGVGAPPSSPRRRPPGAAAPAPGSGLSPAAGSFRVELPVKLS